MAFKDPADKLKWRREYVAKNPERHKAWKAKAIRLKTAFALIAVCRHCKKSRAQQRKKDIASLSWVCARLRKMLTPKPKHWHKCGYCGKSCSDSEWSRKGGHIPCMKTKTKIWRDNGGREWANKWRKKRLKDDSAYLCKTRIKDRIKKAIKLHGKGMHISGSSIQYLGCTAAQAAKYIEQQFVDGMNWDNYGSLWHIDHVMPIASFDISKEQDRHKVFHYSNLQPLWAEDNMRKSDTVPLVHQPRLLI